MCCHTSFMFSCQQFLFCKGFGARNRTKRFNLRFINLDFTDKSSACNSLLKILIYYVLTRQWVNKIYFKYKYCKFILVIIGVLIRYNYTSLCYTHRSQFACTYTTEILLNNFRLLPSQLLSRLPDYLIFDTNKYHSRRIQI